MAFTFTRTDQKIEPTTIWVVQKITLPDGSSIQVGSIPFDRWLNETDVARPFNRHRIVGKESIDFMNKLREEMIQIVDQMKPGEEIQHKGFTLYKTKDQ